MIKYKKGKKEGNYKTTVNWLFSSLKWLGVEDPKVVIWYLGLEQNNNEKNVITLVKCSVYRKIIYNYNFQSKENSFPYSKYLYTDMLFL